MLLEKEVETKKNITSDNIFCADCFDLLKFIKSNSIDLIAIDPPYEINFEQNNWDKLNSLDWETLAYEFNRILKNTGSLIIFQGWSNVLKTQEVLNKHFLLKNWIIYDRIKGRGAKTNLVSTREDILWYVKSENYTYNKMPSTIKKKTGGTIGRKNGCEYRALSNVWTDISPIVPWSKERVKHPTQKPLQLMDRIINIFSNEKDVVLDCFAGSGSAVVSAINNNRKYIGIEKDKKYFEIIKKRINEI